MKKLKFLFLFLFLVSQLSVAQKTLSDILDKYNDHSVPYISVHDLAMSYEALVLDARETEEFKVSHLKGAIFVGYDDFNIESIRNKIKNKNQHIVVYCSLGIRSEVIAKELKKEGYTHVENLYGGIFEWKNENLPVYNMNKEETEKIHAYSSQWSKWLTKGEKVYD